MKQVSGGRRFSQLVNKTLDQEQLTLLMENTVFLALLRQLVRMEHYVLEDQKVLTMVSVLLESGLTGQMTPHAQRLIATLTSGATKATEYLVQMAFSVIWQQMSNLMAVFQAHTMMVQVLLLIMNASPVLQEALATIMVQTLQMGSVLQATYVTEMMEMVSVPHQQLQTLSVTQLMKLLFAMVCAYQTTIVVEEQQMLLELVTILYCNFVLKVLLPLDMELPQLTIAFLVMMVSSVQETMQMMER